MPTIKSLNKWANAHTYYPLDLLRIALGVFLRWSVAAQLPLLIGAVVINFVGAMNISNFITALIIFLICIFFLIYGSGKHSVDYYLKMQQ